MSEPYDCVIHTDGGSRGNPGPAAYAYVIERTGHDDVEEKCYLGRTTNNIAEYTGLVKALEHAQELGARRLQVHSDSELMVKQMRGEYKVKNEGLRPLYQHASRLVDGFDAVDFRHVRREFNKRADRLCNEAMDDPSEAQPRPTKAMFAPPPKAVDPMIEVRERAIAILKESAIQWADDDADALRPEEVWDRLWKLLRESGVVKR